MKHLVGIAFSVDTNGYIYILINPNIDYFWGKVSCFDLGNVKKFLITGNGKGQGRQTLSKLKKKMFIHMCKVPIIPWCSVVCKGYLGGAKG